MSHTPVANTIIRASAGSGKTYQLVRRLVRLLALGVKPEAIVALTFTRKAAGEFFARLLQTLAEFATRPERAGAFVPELAQDTRACCLRLLRTVLSQMDRMRLGTLDSFFAAMVQSLPFELGLTGTGVLMSEQEAKQAHEEVFDALLVDLMRPEHDDARRELLEAWKLASFGSESSRPGQDLSGWLESLQDWFLECPDPERWGNAQRLWPDPAAPIWRTEDDLAKVKVELEERIVIDDFTDRRARDKWLAFFEELENHRPGTPLTDAIEYMLEPKRGEPRLLAEGRGLWKMGSGKEVPLSPEASRLLYRALQIVVGRELRTCCRRTQGRNQLVALYERAYQRAVRRLGRLRFSDLALLLAGRLEPDGGTGWRERWPELRRDMEYRLDARYDHWLFDEFQDTSRRQWRVFENLVDEVLQDPEARRSFFAVGDLKQSIYLWREAEPELFLGVERRYNGHRLEFGSLKVSWRSCVEVLDMVNDTFSSTALLEELLPGAMEWWRFEPHLAADTLKQTRGHTAFLTVEAREDKHEALIALLRHLRPLSRALTCAVLVRTNDQARELAMKLRAALDCEVVCESEEAVATDNPVTLALLSLLQLAAHPGDTFAWNHLRMTPLSNWIDETQATPAQLGSEVRRSLREGGFLAVAKAWSAHLRGACGGFDAFSERRVRQFHEIAATFDATGSRDVDAFLRHAREHRAAPPGGTRALQVMTIHKSKGLEFDVVILPALQTTILDDARHHKLLCERDRDGEIAWILERPPSAVVEWDGRLTEDVKRLEARAAFEGLCRLYVAMTRAKRGLYLLHHENDRAAARSEASLLRRALAARGTSGTYPLPDAPMLQCLYETGTRDWFEQGESPAASATVPVEVPLVSPTPRPLVELLRAQCSVIKRRTPSGEEEHRIAGGSLLSPRRESGRQMGLLVHGLFAELGWLDNRSSAQIEACWAASRWASHEGFEAACELVRACLAEPEVRRWFERHGSKREVWIERAFDLLLDGEWVSGQMDRVVLEVEAQGRVTAATVVDFKTDAVGDDDALRKQAAGYGPQMKLYSEAVQRLTGLPSAKVKAVLVFVARACVVEL